MPGTRTAPDVTTSATYKSVSFHLIDAENNKRSFQIRVPDATTNADIEDAAAKLQLATNASVWKVEVAQLWQGTAQAGNAADDAHIAAFDNIVIRNTNPTAFLTQYTYVPAPLLSLVPDNDEVATDEQVYIDVRDAMLVLLGASYDAIAVRFTRRMERNSSKPA